MHGLHTSYVSCVEELIRNLETLNARFRRSSRARKFTGTLDALHRAIVSHAPYNKLRAAAFGRLSMELHREWEPFGAEELSIIERQDLRLLLLLFIAERLDGLECEYLAKSQRECTVLTFQRVSQLSRSK